jgi:S-adenosylmethionine/arginine decarboxylase-like enzyme
MNKGTHIMFDYDNLMESEYINTKMFTENIIKLLDKTIEQSNLNEIDRSINIFDDDNNKTPPGFAIVVVLDESHISFHSYTKLGILAIDIFTCGECSKDNTRKAGDIIMNILEKTYPSINLKQKYEIKRFIY